MSSSHITYNPRSKASLEAEAAMLANIYSFILRCGEVRRAGEKKKGGPDTAPDNARKESNHVSRNSIIPG